MTDKARYCPTCYSKDMATRKWTDSLGVHVCDDPWHNEAKPFDWTAPAEKLLNELGQAIGQPTKQALVEAALYKTALDYFAREKG